MFKNSILGVGLAAGISASANAYEGMPRYFEYDVLFRVVDRYANCWGTKTFADRAGIKDPNPNMTCYEQFEPEIQQRARQRIAPKDRTYVHKQIENIMVRKWYDEFPKRDLFTWNLLFEDAESVSNSCSDDIDSSSKSDRLMGKDLSAYFYKGINCIHNTFYKQMPLMYEYMYSVSAAKAGVPVYRKLTDCMAARYRLDSRDENYITGLADCIINTLTEEEKEIGLRMALDAIYSKTREWLIINADTRMKPVKYTLNAADQSRYCANTTGQYGNCMILYAGALLTSSITQMKNKNIGENQNLDLFEAIRFK